MIKEIITTILVGIASIFGISDNKIHNLGAFSDPFLSIQLAESPSNDYCLKTNGTDNLWSSSCGTGGSGAGWASTTADINSIYFTGDGIGKVGIGTSSAFAVLAVNPTAGQASNQFVIGSSTGTSLIVKNTGFVGIGTVVPDTPLDVVSTNQGILKLRRSSTSLNDSARIQFSVTSVPTAFSSYIEAIRSDASGGNDIAIGTGLLGGAATEKMRVTGSGNVGIGTTTPAALLNVEGSAAEIGRFGRSNTGAGWITLSRANAIRGYLGFEGTSGGGLLTGSLADSLVLRSQGAMHLNTNGGLSATTGVTIDTSGNVGIGTTSPLGVLSVTNVGASPSFIVEDSTSPDTSPFIIDANGNVGIGTTTPMGKFNITDAIVQTASTSGIQDVLVVQNSNSIPRAELQYDNSQVKLKFNYPVTNTDLFVMQMNTNLTGIGTTTPYSTFSVTNTQSNPSFVVEDTTSPDTTPFLIDNSGNVGIGTTTPVSKLNIQDTTGAFITLNSSDTAIIQGDVLGGLDFYSLDTSSGMSGVWGRIRYEGNGVWDGTTGDGADLIFSTRTVSDGSLLDKMILTAAGNLGIGTTTPGQRLSIAGDILGNSIIGSYFTATSTSVASIFPYASTTAISAGTICFTSDTCRTSWPTGGSGAFPFTPTTFGATNANSTSTLIGFTAGIYSLASSTIGNGTQTTGLTISGGATTTGNAYFASSVGMGTQSPSNKLHIFTSTNSEDGIMIENSNSGTTAASSFYLKNDSSVVGGATIFSSGYNLTHLRNRATFLSQNGITLITDSNVSSGGSNNIQFLTGGYNSSNERMRLTSGGLLGIATTSPWRTLSVAGTVSFNGLTSSATGNAVCITTGKDITDAGGGTCTPSSIRFKENIEKLPSGFAIGQLGKLEIVSFDYKNKDPHETNHSYGMIAEEVEKIDNNLVDYGYDGKPLTLHFEKITGLLVQAVQEILTSIKSITNRQDNLEKIITEQQKQIDVLQRELSAIKVNK